MKARIIVGILTFLLASGCSTRGAQESSNAAVRVETQSQSVLATANTGNSNLGLNAFRASNGLPPLTVSRTLERIAQDHARDMDRNNFFDHRSRNGASPGDRARAAGYKYRLIAENIASGQRSAAGAVRGWIDSPAHRDNLLLRGVTEYGLSSSGSQWVMVLARPR